jgi:SAM-dependent methyltransferase
VDAADITELATPAGERLLAEVAERLTTDPELSVLERVGARVGPARASAAVAQVTLRAQAGGKFVAADAARMFFTPTGLEQATRTRVATHRAAVAADRSGGGALTDLGCGLGADLIAFARAGFDVTGVELDPLTAACAAANLRALGLAGRVVVGDATTAERPPGGVVFCDPARRDERGRVFDLAKVTPPWPFVLDLLAGTACIKVGPGIAHRDVPAEVRGTPVSAEWVSDDATVTEACLRSGRLADPAGAGRTFSATVLRSTGPGGSTLTGDPGVRASAGTLGEYLYEPDGAVIRAGLIGTLAPSLQAHLLDDQIAYLSSPVLTRSVFARPYRILEELPHRTKALKAAVRARRIGTLTIKKRGVDLDPAVLRRELLGARGHGSAVATIVLTRQAGRGVALLVEPID